VLHHRPVNRQFVCWETDIRFTGWEGGGQNLSFSLCGSPCLLSSGFAWLSPWGEGSGTWSWRLITVLSRVV